MNTITKSTVYIHHFGPKRLYWACSVTKQNMTTSNWIFQRKNQARFQELSELLFRKFMVTILQVCLITRYETNVWKAPYDRENSKKFHPLQWCSVRMHDEKGSTSGADKTSETPAGPINHPNTTHFPKICIKYM